MSSNLEDVLTKKTNESLRAEVASLEEKISGKLFPKSSNSNASGNSRLSKKNNKNTRDILRDHFFSHLYHQSTNYCKEEEEKIYPLPKIENPSTQQILSDIWKQLNEFPTSSHVRKTSDGNENKYDPLVIDSENFEGFFEIQASKIQNHLEKLINENCLLVHSIGMLTVREEEYQENSESNTREVEKDQPWPLSIDEVKSVMEMAQDYSLIWELMAMYGINDPCGYGEGNESKEGQCRSSDNIDWDIAMDKKRNIAMSAAKRREEGDGLRNLKKDLCSRTNTSPSSVILSKVNVSVQTDPEDMTPLDAPTCHIRPTDRTAIVRYIPSISNSDTVNQNQEVKKEQRNVGTATLIHHSDGQSSKASISATVRYLSHYDLNCGNDSTVLPSGQLRLSNIPTECHENPFSPLENTAIRNSYSNYIYTGVLPTLPHSHLHQAWHLDDQFERAITNTNTFRGLLQWVVANPVSHDALIECQPPSLRFLILNHCGKWKDDIKRDPVRMITSITTIIGNAVTVGILVIQDHDISIFRDNSLNDNDDCRHLLIPKGAILQVQIGGNTGSPPLSFGSIPSPSLNFFISNDTPLSEIVQQYYRQIIITAILKTQVASKNPPFGLVTKPVETSVVIIFNTESDMTKFLSLMELDLNGSRGDPFSPYYVPCSTPARLIPSSSSSMIVNQTSVNESNQEAERKSMLRARQQILPPLPRNFDNFGWNPEWNKGKKDPHPPGLSWLNNPTAQMRHAKAAVLNKTITTHNDYLISQAEYTFCCLHHIHPRYYTEIKQKLLMDPSIRWFSALDLIALCPPSNGKELNFYLCRVLLEYFLLGNDGCNTDDIETLERDRYPLTVTSCRWWGGKIGLPPMIEAIEVIETLPTSM